jgi:hypothetical protein
MRKSLLNWIFGRNKHKTLNSFSLDQEISNFVSNVQPAFVTGTIWTPYIFGDIGRLGNVILQHISI